MNLNQPLKNWWMVQVEPSAVKSAKNNEIEEEIMVGGWYLVLGDQYLRKFKHQEPGTKYFKPQVYSSGVNPTQRQVTGHAFKAQHVGAHAQIHTMFFRHICYMME